MSVLKNYYSEQVLDDSYKFTPSGVYYAPPEGDLQSFREYINDLPLTEAPEVFGMHPNADITFQMQETRKMMECVVSIQPRATTAEGGQSPDDLVAALAEEIEGNVLPPMDTDDAADGLFDRTDSGQLKSLSVVLGQEIERFNRLTQVVLSSLKQLRMAIKGSIVVTDDLEHMHTNLLNNQVPLIWQRAAYPSLKPLGGWMLDYGKRIRMMSEWLRRGEPLTYWLPGFFFPQGFMTGVLQTHARKYQQPIDSLNFKFEVLEGKETAEDVTHSVTDGVLIDGLFVDNARWNRKGKFLDESEPGVMCSSLPVIHFVPAQHSAPPALLAESDPKEYQCPLYKTSVRAGILSTTGQSTNFVLCVGLPIRQGTESDFWVLQGVALLCALND
jgi:dynein heavy chain